LTALGAYWTAKGGVSLGIVGDANHTSGYHLGRDRIYDGSGPGLGDQDYSVQLPRDKAGLSGAAAAIDLGKLGWSYKRLYDFSRWLVAECQTGADGSRDVREIIYSPDGSQVQRWSGVDGDIHTGPGNGDASHRYHTHISYYRDSEARGKIGLFRGFFDANGEDAMDFYPLPGGDGTVTIKEGRGLVNLVTGRAVQTTDYVKTSHCRIHLAESFGEGAGRQDGYLVRHAQQAHVALDDVVETFVPSTVVPSDPVPAVLTSEDGAVRYQRV
jgi:hypothetical protein